MMWDKKKKTKKPKKPRGGKYRWMRSSFLALGISTTLLMAGCATMGVVKNEVLPGVKQVFMAAGPNLAAALVADLSSFLDLGFTYAMKPFELAGLTPTAPIPAPNP